MLHLELFHERDPRDMSMGGHQILDAAEQCVAECVDANYADSVIAACGFSLAVDEAPDDSDGPLGKTEIKMRNRAI
ncbi:MAG: hypothetical protein KIT18_10875 [Burkholderiales bacterium]|nr:hypothetical protein [Burkholderiales bacterium]